MTAGATVAWGALLQQAADALAQSGVADHTGDARRLVERASGTEGAEYLSVLDEPASRLGVAHFDAMLERRLAGEPLQYVLGAWGFRRLDLFIDRRVLIPRPETEVVVEHALGLLDARPAHRERGRAVDLGTGSGAIALSLAFERERVEVWATDASADALEVARANLGGLGRAAARVQLAQGPWFAALPAELRGTLDVVVSNPPYVTTTEVLPPEVAEWEPVEALRAGPEGIEAHREIIESARSWLAPGGGLVLELAPDQAARVAALAADAGFEDVAVQEDLAGRARVLVARWGAARR
jgi:release factor glutamine methyltransferase